MKLKKNEILVLRTCKSDGTSRNEFVWPEKGPVEAPDWDPEPVCGGGLHGLPWGVGGDYLSRDSDALWQLVVVAVTAGNYISGVGEIKDKCKFRAGVVIFTGSHEAAIKRLHEYAPVAVAISYDIATQGNGSTATQGDRSTATQGNYSTATQGNDSTATQGDRSTATQGNGSTATQGNGSTATQGNYSTATQGNDSTATQGDDSTATQGDDSTATQGDGSTATQGDGSTATQGNYSTATQGNGSTATQGDRSTATQGNGSTATQGDRSTATQGDYSTATQGDDSTATQGNYSWYRGASGNIIISRYWTGRTYCIVNHVVTDDESGKWIHFSNGIYVSKEKHA